MFIQLLKFRLVVSPKVQIAKNTHNETKIKYYFAKGFWINEEGKEYRKFIKSVGRVDAFKGGKNDHELNEEAAKNADFDEILKSQRKFSAQYAHWKRLAYLPRDF